MMNVYVIESHEPNDRWEFSGFIHATSQGAIARVERIHGKGEWEESSILDMKGWLSYFDAVGLVRVLEVKVDE